MAISLFIQINGKFPGGATQYPYIDANGGGHLFTSISLFQSFASAICDYVAALDFVIAGASLTIPSPTTTIA